MKSHKPRGISRWSEEIALAIMFIAGALALRYVSDGSISEKTATPTPLAPTQIEYTQSELEAFWNAHGKPVIRDQLLEGLYPIPEIQNRYTFLVTKIKERYDKFNFELSTVHSIESRAVGGCRFTNGAPSVIIFVPDCIDLYNSDFERLYGAQKDDVFETFVVGIVMHEMEHIAGDQRRQPGETRSDVLVRNEKSAWASTCIHTISPLVEKYRKTLPSGDKIFYNEWINANRDEKDPIWDTFIRSNYKDAKVLPDEEGSF